MNKAMLAWVFLVVAGAGWCQGAPQVTTLKLVIATRQQTALVGEPVYFSAQVTNEGPITAIVKVNSGDVMGPWLYMGCCKEALVIQAPDGHIHYGAFSVLYAVLKPGETKSTSDANCDGLVLSQPGHYNVWAELESTGVSAEPTVSPNPPRYDYFWKGHAISNACSIDILAPTGVDAAAYQAFKGNPLAHPVDLLKRFPTSTYAGYALRERIPALAREALADLNDPDGTLYRWGNLGGGEATIHLHIIEAQKDMEGFAAAAQAFLRAHPDFIYAAEIRRGYAMCLGLTGHLPEAMSEIQTLSTGTGKEADEAKAFLGEKTPTKPAKEGGYQP